MPTPITAKVVALSAEARVRTTRDMWRVRSNQPLGQRLGKTAAGALLRNEFVRTRAVGRVARSMGDLAVLGHGSEQLVMTEGDQVVKLILASISKEAKVAQDTAQTLQQQNEAFQAHLGDYWLPTDFDTIRLRGSDKTAVVARQELLVGPRLYHTAGDVEVGSQTEELAERIRTLYADTSLYPDLLGVNNLARRQDTAQLCILDTIPVSAQSQSNIPQGHTETVAELIEARLAVWAAEEFPATV